MFLILMVIGLTGLIVMAVPAFGRHGGAGKLGHSHGHALHLPKLAAKSAPPAAPGHALVPSGHDALVRTDATAGMMRFVPSPRLIFSVLALYGAFANALVHAAHLTTLAAALVAILPALAVERLAVTPLWNWLFRFQADPSSPLEMLLQAEARAVTAFPNGRGIVSVVRDGRTVQFSARLVEQQLATIVRVGDRLRVEDVDAKNERLTVSLVVA